MYQSPGPVGSHLRQVAPDSLLAAWRNTIANDNDMTSPKDQISLSAANGAPAIFSGMALMAKFMSPEERIKHLEESCRRVGGKAELGRRLGYKDGSYVSQMLSGLRPITEKTIAQLLEMRELAGLWAFDATQPGFGVKPSKSGRCCRPMFRRQSAWR